MPHSMNLDREQQLNEVLAAYLLAVKNGTAPRRQELLDQYPDLADDLASFFTDQDRFAHLAAPLRDVVQVSGERTQPRDFGDYELLQEIARGGMGVVYKARQKNLDRVVALKMLLAGPLASADDVRRFQREAEAAASLDHPHIVPIHEVGSHDGQPFLCMKLVEGGTIAACGLRNENSPHDESLPRQRVIAKHMATVARAVHYAHQRGLLHRDLKPANILLQYPDNPQSKQFATPLVTDFGLAKRATTSETSPLPDTPSTAHTVKDQAALTHSGAILGTPAYMAPEQASGLRDAVTTAADVYGLGAILYELLTGRPPFRGSTPLDTLHQVLKQEPVRPRSIHPDVDRDLEIICLKCLAKEPVRRYASADDLADDLERFLAGKPIQARLVGSIERAWRWAWRQPVVAGLGLALALAVIIGFVLVTWQWRRAEHHALVAEERRQEAEANTILAEVNGKEAADQRDAARRAERERAVKQHDAEESFHLAHKVVSEFCLRVARELASVPGLQPLRKSLLESALTYFREFLRQRGNDPTLRVEKADAHFNIARITEGIGPKNEARNDYRKALDLYRDVLRDRPTDRQVQFRLGHVLNNLAIIEESTNEALPLLIEARKVYDAALKAHPRDLELRSGLANALNNQGTIQVDHGNLDDARISFREASKVLDGLMRDRPRSQLFPTQLAVTLNNVGTLANRVGDQQEGQRVHRQAQQLWKKLTRENPKDAHLQAEYAGSCHNLGITLRDSGKLDEAKKYFEEALTVRKKLVEAYPLVTLYQNHLAASYNNLGLFHRDQKRYDQSLKAHAEARKLIENLLRVDTGSADLRKHLAVTFFYTSNTLGASNRRADERKALQEACRLQEALLRADPNNLNYRIDLSNTLQNLAPNLWDAGQRDEGRILAHQAIDNLRVAVQRAPRVAMYRRKLNSHYSLLAEIEIRSGRTREALEALLERQKLWPDNPRELYATACSVARVAERVGQGKKELTSTEQNERRRLLDLTMKKLRQAVEHGFQDGARLRKESSLQPVREREDYRQLERDLDARDHQPK